MLKYDEKGNRYGNLLVEEYIKGKCLWRCKCDCGNITYALGKDLRQGKIISCGCQRGLNKLNNLEGKKFGMLTVISYDTSKNQWLCKCDCGNTTYTNYDKLKRGAKKSCGCLKLDKVLAKEYLDNPNYQRLSSIWDNMKRRCYDKTRYNYRWYGAKGVKICDEWHEFRNFIEWAINNGYEDNLEIDRIDPNKDYCPENCRWITKSENVRRTFKK